MRTFSQIVFRNSAWGLGAHLTVKVLSFVFSVLIIRNLGAEAFGQYSAVLAFGMTFAFISDLGLSVYSVRQIARWRDSEDEHPRSEALFADVLTVRLMLAVLAAIFILLAAWLTGRPLVMIGALVLNSLSLLLYAVQGTTDAILSGYERLDISSRSRVYNQLGFVIVGGVALYLGLGYYGLILANILGVSWMTWVCWGGVRDLGLRPRGRDQGKWGKLLKAAFPFGLIGFSLGLSYKFDTILLNIFRTDVETGYYNAAYNLVFSAVTISAAINVALYPSLTREVANSPERLWGIVQRAFRYLLLISIPIAVGGWVLSDEIIRFLYESEYLAAIPALKVVIWAVPLMYASEFLGYIVIISNKEAFAARAVTVSTVFNIFLNLILVPRYGVPAAAGMTVLTETILVGQYVWFLRKDLTRLRWGQVLGRPVLATLLMGTAVWLARPVIPFLLNVAFGVLTYGVLLILLGAVGLDEINFLLGILRRREPSLPHS